nr:glycosyltransferase family 2 protein [Salinisphaera halophila]
MQLAGVHVYSSLTRPAISAVIPSYRRYNEVVRATRSVLAQTLAPLEVIVVNDGPDGRKARLLAELGDERIRFLEAVRRGSASATRNHGIRYARGDWVALLDDDDVWLPGKLEAQFSTLEGSGHTEAILAGQERVHLSNGRTHLRPPGADGEPVAAVKMLFGGRGVHTSALLAPTSAFRRYPFNEDAERHEDWEWLLQAGRELPVIVAPDVVCERWMRPGEGLSRPGGFDYTWNWYLRNRALIDTHSRVRLICGPLTRKAAFDRTPSALLRLLPELRRNEGLSPSNIVRISVPWLISSKLREFARNRLTRDTQQ